MLRSEKSGGVTGSLDGKTALVTGGNSGIGLATASAFLREGARLAITGRDPDTLAAARESLGREVLALQVDVRRLDDLDRLYAEIGEQLGSLDVLFANAGVGIPCPLDAFTEELFDEIYDINVKGTFFTVQKALPLLNRGAAIVLNASIAAYTGVPGFSAYGSSKAAVRALARLLAADLVDRDVRVNVVTPGAIRTPIWERGLPGGPAAVEENERRLVARVPMGRMGEAAEIAEAVLFLASGLSSYVTGGEVIVDGGIVDLPAAIGRR